ncbi:MAG: hypothetical protein RLZZ215_406 [Pseudomonadota bacterium]|jgi:hypothetical protein
MNSPVSTEQTNNREWLGGKAAARFLGFDNHSAISHLPIKHLRIQGKDGRINYRYKLADLEAFKQSCTYGELEAAPTEAELPEDFF